MRQFILTTSDHGDGLVLPSGWYVDEVSETYDDAVRRLMETDAPVEPDATVVEKHRYGPAEWKRRRADEFKQMLARLGPSMRSRQSVFTYCAEHPVQASQFAFA